MVCPSTYHNYINPNTNDRVRPTRPTAGAFLPARVGGGGGNAIASRSRQWLSSQSRPSGGRRSCVALARRALQRPKGQDQRIADRRPGGEGAELRGRRRRRQRRWLFLLPLCRIHCCRRRIIIVVVSARWGRVGRRGGWRWTRGGAVVDGRRRIWRLWWLFFWSSLVSNNLSPRAKYHDYCK